MLNFKTNLSIIKGIITKKSPFYVCFFISNKCNLNCKMCNIMESNKNYKEISLDKIEKIAKNLASIGTAIVVLTGGEPFFREDIADIVKIFKKYGITTRLQTNGYIKKFDNMLACSKLGSNDINISLDTLDEKLADYINGAEGSWKNSIRTIARITREFSTPNAVCAIMCTLSPYNINHVESLVEFVNTIGWSIAIAPVHINSDKTSLNFRGYDKNFIFSKNDKEKIEILIDKLKKKKSEGANIFPSNKFLSSIINFVNTGVASWRKNDICDSPNLYFIIKPDGSFAPCTDQDINEKIYVYNNDFVEKFKSGHIAKITKEITKNCSGCNYSGYPEISLTCRNFDIIIEHGLLELKTLFKKKKSFTDDEIFEIIRKIREKYNY